MVSASGLLLGIFTGVYWMSPVITSLLMLLGLGAVSTTLLHAAYFVCLVLVTHDLLQQYKVQLGLLCSPSPPCLTGKSGHPGFLAGWLAWRSEKCQVA